MSDNQKWSEKPLITSIYDDSEFCILDGSPKDNKRINIKLLMNLIDELNPNKYQYSRWHPDGVVFKYNIIELDDGSKKETISYSNGNIFIHEWPSNLNTTLKNISYNNIEITTNEVETPVFTLGES